MRKYKILHQKAKWYNTNIDMEQFEGMINAYARVGWKVVKISYRKNYWYIPFIFALLEKETTPKTQQTQQTEETQ
jgi:hypothetical protein